MNKINYTQQTKKIVSKNIISKKRYKYLKGKWNTDKEIYEIIIDEAKKWWFEKELYRLLSN